MDSFGKTFGRHSSRANADMSVNRPVMKKKGSHKHKHKHHVSPSTSTAVSPPRQSTSTAVSPPRQSIVGCRIKHKWKEDCHSPISHWTGTVLDQIAVNPSLYLIKYDGFDCVYGLEILNDERVQDLEILPQKIASYRISDARFAESILGQAVEHQFEMDDGTKNGWRGLVLGRAPMMPSWFFITYEKDPVLYLYQLLEDYNQGDLRIVEDTEEPVKESGVESLVGKQVEYVKEDGIQRTGTVIHQVESKPSVYFIKFHDDYHIYVYDMV